MDAPVLILDVTVELWGYEGWGLHLVEVPVEVERVVYEERIVEVSPVPQPLPSTAGRGQPGRCGTYRSPRTPL